MKVHRLSGYNRGIRSAFGRRGVATVEMAIILPLLAAMLFGTLEIGLMAKTAHSLHHVAREASRVASTGATLSRIQSHIANTAPELNTNNLTTTLEYRSWDETAGAWGTWTTLSDDGTQNTAVSGDQIRVQVQYPHSLATKGIFSMAVATDEGNTVSLDASIVSMRE